jgi:hypothetical protein
MAAGIGNSLEADARRGALMRGLTRPESLIIAGVSVALAAVSFFVQPLRDIWWVWLVFGVLGSFAIAFSHARNKATVHKVKEAIVEETIDANELQVSELQAGVARAMYQHKTIQKMIAVRTEAFGQLPLSLDEWLGRVNKIARGLDTILRHPRVLEHFYSVMQTNEVKSANLDSIAAFQNAAGLVIAGHGDQELDEEYNKLVFARDAVAQVRAGINTTIDHVVSIAEVLRHTRAMTLSTDHIQQMSGMLQSELDTLLDLQKLVYKLGSAYEVTLQ